MKLHEISKEAEEYDLLNVLVNTVTDDSNAFQSGDIFVCIKGKNFDGHSFAKEAAERGAAAVVTERDLGLDCQIVVPDSREYYSFLASNFYGNPTKSLKLIAVTGTNGKSTIAAFIKHILENTGHKTGSIGTIGYDTTKNVYEAHLTTPRQMELYRLFREMADNGAEYCVIEASSQALAQNRFAEESFECAIFTNLTQDHLDYHKTMERYYKAKRSLFDKSKSAIICEDDKYGKKLIKYVKSVLKRPCKTYSVKDAADYYAVNIKSSGNKTHYWFSSLEAEKSFPIEIKMPGVFNIANSIAAIAAAAETGIYLNDAVAAMKSLAGVSGRSEIIYDGKITVIRDYAHTEDALEKFLSEIKNFANGRIICLFGAAGERDKAKRPHMGETAAIYSDYLVITSDNPRFENPSDIINEVVTGVKKYDTPYLCVTDRREAVKAALSEAKEGDTVVLCGKGHETYQVIGDEYLPFDEKIIVKEILGV